MEGDRTVVRAEVGRQSRAGIQLLGGDLAVGLLEELLLETQLAIVETRGRAAPTTTSILGQIGHGLVAIEREALKAFRKRLRLRLLLRLVGDGVLSDLDLEMPPPPSPFALPFFLVKSLEY